MPTVTLSGAGRSSVTIHHHGAHVTSWLNATGRDMLYTSPQAILDGTKAIRGGIPICFPQFGKHGALRQHGFARNMPWTLSSSTPTSATFTLSSTAHTLASAWPHPFSARYIVSLAASGDALHISMAVRNEDRVHFSFTTALHSYFTVDHPESASVPELDAETYKDSLDEDAEKVQSGPVVFHTEVDRVYYDTKDSLSIPEVGLVLHKRNLPEAVVWNPYVDRSKEMADLPDDGWKHFICIEPARIAHPAVVQPGEEWTCEVTLSSK